MFNEQYLADIPSARLRIAVTDYFGTVTTAYRIHRMNQSTSNPGVSYVQPTLLRYTYNEDTEPVIATATPLKEAAGSRSFNRHELDDYVTALGYLVYDALDDLFQRDIYAKERWRNTPPFEQYKMGELRGADHPIVNFTVKTALRQKIPCKRELYQLFELDAEWKRNTTPNGVYLDGGRFTLSIRSLADYNRPVLHFCEKVSDIAIAATLIRAIAARNMNRPSPDVEWEKLCPECRKLMAKLRIACIKHTEAKAQHGVWGGPDTTSRNVITHLNQLDSKTLRRIAAGCTRLADALDKATPGDELAAALGSIEIKNWFSYERGWMQQIQGSEVVQLSNGSIWSVYADPCYSGYKLQYYRLDEAE